MEKCTGPQEILDRQLDAYLDGASSPGVEAHLAACAHCAGRLAELRSFDRGLRARLRRADCPSADDLRAERLRAICDHVAFCRTCGRELVSYRGPEPLVVTEDSAALSGFVHRMAHFVARLVPPIPAAIPVLRGVTTEPTVHQVAETGWELMLVQDTEARGYTLSGQLLGPDPQSLAEGYVTALAGGLAPQEAEMDASGWFELRPLVAGRYLLWIEIPGTRITVPDVDIGKAD